jgi:hypothetical protein
MDWVGPTAPDFWYSDYMPRTKDGFLAIASDELISMMENPAYHQPQEPLSGNYNQAGVMGTAERQGEPTGPPTRSPTSDGGRLSHGALVALSCLAAAASFIM